MKMWTITKGLNLNQFFHTHTQTKKHFKNSTIAINTSSGYDLLKTDFVVAVL